MKAELINPFVEAAKKVIEAEVRTVVHRGELSLQASPYTTMDITTLVAVTGEVQGIVLYSLQEAAALAFVEAMIGQPFHTLDDLAVSGIAEMGNVITGNAGIALAEAGFTTKIAPPVVIIGNGTKISTLDIQRLVVPLSSSLGTLEVQVALREVPRNGNPASD